MRWDDSDLLLKINLKNALNKKIILRVWNYLQGEHLILLTDKGLTMKYMIYSISKTNILIYKFGFSAIEVAAN